MTVKLLKPQQPALALLIVLALLAAVPAPEGAAAPAPASGASRQPYDGVYGPLTVERVRRFQASRGLKADGLAGPATQRALGLKLGRSLKPGMTGPDVARLQAALARRGFWSVPRPEPVVVLPPDETSDGGWMTPPPFYTPPPAVTRTPEPLPEAAQSPAPHPSSAPVGTDAPAGEEQTLRPAFRLKAWPATELVSSGPAATAFNRLAWIGELGVWRGRSGLSLAGTFVPAPASGTPTAYDSWTLLDVLFHQRFGPLGLVGGMRGSFLTIGQPQPGDLFVSGGVEADFPLGLEAVRLTGRGLYAYSDSRTQQIDGSLALGYYLENLSFEAGYRYFYASEWTPGMGAYALHGPTVGLALTF